MGVLEENPHQERRLYNAKGKIGNQASAIKSSLSTQLGEGSTTRIIRGYL
ncbi:MAG: hypothetical protein ACI8PD_000846 [Nitrospinales bacterium]|jgi:hypothetical protein